MTQYVNGELSPDSTPEPAEDQPSQADEIERLADNMPLMDPQAPDSFLRQILGLLHDMRQEQRAGFASQEDVRIEAVRAEVAAVSERVKELEKASAAAERERLKRYDDTAWKVIVAILMVVLAGGVMYLVGHGGHL